ncbi:MAG TPA: alkaline phosphatase family protein, partial [Urbifossiella sp.]|nr:alkaline phosphatase family protein [Urbifossiella sp.]
MFENRSFDHILGAMPGVNGLLVGGAVGPDFYNTMNPTQEMGGDNPATWPVPIVPSATPYPTLPTESDLISHDFNHDFGDGMSQDLYGPGTTGVIGGQPQGNPAVTYPATNSGFLSTVAYNVGTSQHPVNGNGALSYFAWESLQVFHTLAKAFLVCDAWHCDMPGHTAPNRAFMHCATTGTLRIDDNDGISSMVNELTVFERIHQTGQTWKVYWPGANLDTDWLNEQVMSQLYDENDPTAFNVTKVPIKNFFTDLQTGQLPFYSFVMCWNDGPRDTSMHPASQVEPGEDMLACVYNALRASPYWANTLLVVNFDENGGMYDHVAVPRTTPPVGGSPVSTWDSQYTGRTYSFDFSVLGVRTPVLLISPWLNAGVCGTQYQNTSVLRFLQDKLPRANPADPYYLTGRDLAAPSLAPVFDYDQFGMREMRADCPSNITTYGGLDACTQFWADITPTAESLAAPPAPHAARLTRTYLAPLPGHPDSGKPLTRDFATVGEMRAYADERRAAALAYVRAKRAQPPA